MHALHDFAEGRSYRLELAGGETIERARYLGPTPSGERGRFLVIEPAPRGGPREIHYLPSAIPGVTPLDAEEEKAEAADA